MNRVKERIESAKQSEKESVVLPGYLKCVQWMAAPSEVDRKIFYPGTRVEGLYSDEGKIEGGSLHPLSILPEKSRFSEIEASCAVTFKSNMLIGISFQVEALGDMDLLTFSNLLLELKVSFDNELGVASKGDIYLDRACPSAYRVWISPTVSVVLDADFERRQINICAAPPGTEEVAILNPQ